MIELYRKHRPKKLSRVVGNSATVDVITGKLEDGTFPHTSLFMGPSGCGKTTLARIVKDELGVHDMDFVEMNCSDFRGIDTMRDIMRKMRLAPVGPCRVYLMDEVHQLSKDAQNSALKMFEDTPSHVYFLLCTTDPQKLLKTIRTRCTEFPVGLLNDTEMGKLIKRVMRREKLDVSEVLDDLVDAAEGSPRTALVLLDKIRKLPDDKRLDAIQSGAGDASAQVIDLCRALIGGKSWSAVSKILRTIKDDPEKVRWAVLGYASAVLLSKPNDTAFAMIEAFQDNFYDSKKAGLVRACFEVVRG